MLALQDSLAEAFQTYIQMYYDSGLCTARIKRDAEKAFTVTLLVKKVAEEEDAAHWDAIHVIEVEEGEQGVQYRATSSVILSFSSLASPESGDEFVLAGTLYRQSERQSAKPEHIVVIGQLVEEAESKLRSLMQEVYFVRVRETVSQLRDSGLEPTGGIRILTA